MEILDSTTYVNLKEQKDIWYQLSVISMWDWSTKPVCYKYIGRDLISFCLYKCTPISENTYNTESITDLTDEMKDILNSKGYSLK